MTTRGRSVWLLALAAAILAAPLTVPGLKGAFKGSDDRATEAISAIAPGYEPWAEPIWTPPSDEVGSMLFALQAALGAGVIGYAIGRRRSGSGRDVAD